MMDDYRLFTPTGAGGDSVDPDVALITAYLARELSLVQIIAVEGRLATDAAFRNSVQTIIDTWRIPGEIDDNGGTTVRPALLSRKDKDRGWQRFLAHDGSTVHHDNRADADTRIRIATPERGIARRTRSTAKVAALIALILLPIIGIAQTAAYFARRAASGGGATPEARRLDPVGAGPSIDSRRPIIGEPEREARDLMPVPRAAQSQDSLAKLRLVRESTIGGPGMALSGFSTVRVGPKDQVLVPQSGQRRALIFDSTGQLIRRLGDDMERDGLGVMGGAVARFGWVGDSVWVSEPLNERMLIFGPDGKQVGKTELDRLRPSRADAARVPVLHFMGAVALYGDRSVLAAAGPDARDPRVVSGEFSGSRFVVVGRDGVIRRVLGTVPRGTTEVTYQVPGRFTWCSAALPVENEAFWSVTPDGQRIGTASADVTSSAGGDIQLTVFGVTGDTAFTRAIPFAGIPVNQAAVQRELDEIYAGILSRPSPCGPAQAQHYKATALGLIPPATPPLRQLMMGNDGTVWLQVATLGYVGFLAFDDRGAPLGRLQLPPSSTMVAAERGRVWVAERGANGIFLVRYRVEREGR